MNKIIFLDRYSPESRFWKNMVKKKRYDLPLEEIVERYKGFEGELIQFVDLENQKIDLDGPVSTSTLKYSDAIFVSDYQSSDRQADSQLTFVGFDVGICEWENTLYSSIFNEILFGSIEQLVHNSKLLNEHLLFPTISDAEAYVRQHHELLLQGKDVEQEQMAIYTIWA